MTPDRRDRISQLYHAVLERPPEARAAFLEDACGGDEFVRQEVESLLSHEPGTSRFLERAAGTIMWSGLGRVDLIGHQIGPYKIVAPLGAGGMGEVYRARDTKLDRDVAIKILPAHFMADPERRARLVREAQLLARLNHPRIGAIYGLEDSDGLTGLVLELVDGPTLAQRLDRGPLKLAEALPIARQIAEALEAAHDQGIVHRDLKPANIVLRGRSTGMPADSQVKVLDFGLAKLVQPVGDAATASSVALQSSEAGLILGTPAYMSPEQARGQTVDKRTDVWAFGCVLFEMLAGRPAFAGQAISDTFAGILEREPDWTALPAKTPESIRRLLERCLRKDSQKRLHDIADARIELDEPTPDPRASSRPPRSQRVAWMTAAALAIAAFGLAVWNWPRPTIPVSFDPVPLTSLPGSELDPTFSPDGSQVAFAWDREEEPIDVFVQVVGNADQPHRIARDGAQHQNPAWSPSGSWIAMWHGLPNGQRRLALISPFGGPERTLVELNRGAGRITWSPDSRWVAISTVATRGVAGQGIVLVSAKTGERIDWSSIDPVFSSSEDPSFSPDGRRLVYVHRGGDLTGEVFYVEVAADGKPVGHPLRLSCPVNEASSPLLTEDGRAVVLINRGDLVRMALEGSCEETRIASGVSGGVAVSRSGKRLAFSTTAGDSDIERVDLQGAGGSTLVAHSTQRDSNAVYSPDGSRIVFKSSRTGSAEIWEADAKGENALRLSSFGEEPRFGTFRWSPDGSKIAFDRRVSGNSDIFVIQSGGGAIWQLTTSPSEDARPAWSDDGYLYFSSMRGGTPEIWRMRDGDADAVQITRGGGYAVLAGGDGWLYYTAGWFSTIRRIRPDGSGDTLISQEPIQGSMFCLTPGKLWFATAAGAGDAALVIKALRLDDRTIAERRRLPAYSTDFTTFSVSPDERHALVTRFDRRGRDLWLVDTPE
ncbi:MAG TPA: protein kinase [Vicinamibacterales bacterium]|nr:protein kinase [Vicinamibacterales bacterium]